MEFFLYYRGELSPQAKKGEKQNLRRHFHLQMKELWTHRPLNLQRTLLAEPSAEGDVAVYRKKYGFVFAPLVCNSLSLVVELDILMLWAAAPGGFLSRGGDIDNRVKSLLDGLRVPAGRDEMPQGDEPRDGEDPFFTLLEDDCLVTRLSVETGRLLEPNLSPWDVALTIRVRTRSTMVSYANIGLG